MAITSLGSLREALHRISPASDRQGRRGSVLARWARDRKAASAILFGLSLPVLIGFVGLGVETAYWYLEKRELQEAADSAALAGASEFANNDATQAVMVTAATAAVAKSGFSGVTPTINQPPASGLFAPGGIHADPNAVEAIVTETYSTYFVSLFGIDSVDIATRAVAVQGGGALVLTACILALAKGYPNEPEICGKNATGIKFQGSLSLTLEDCSVHSNDSCGPSYDIDGNPTIVVDCLSYSGGLDSTEVAIDGTSSNLTMTGCDTAVYAPPVADPYDNVYVPPFTNPTDCMANPYGDPDPTDLTNTAKRVFSPGYYCDLGNASKTGGIGLLTNTGDVNTLQPGVYFIEGDVLINGASLIGENGVTFVIMDTDATFDFRGNGNLILTAPSTGDIYATLPANPAYGEIYDQGIYLSYHYWDGLALYINSKTDLGDSNPCPNKINGTSIIKISGAIYAPNTCITFDGNNTAGAADDPCFRLIAGNITLNGNVDMSSKDCDLTGVDGDGITYGTLVGLVE